MTIDLDSMFFQFGNVHIISGPNGMCECGKDSKTCYERLSEVASKYMELNATSTNKPMPKLPTLEECVSYYEGHCDRVLLARDTHIINHIHDYISRQLQHS